VKSPIQFNKGDAGSLMTRRAVSHAVLPLLASLVAAFATTPTHTVLGDAPSTT